MFAKLSYVHLHPYPKDFFVPCSSVLIGQCISIFRFVHVPWQGATEGSDLFVAEQSGPLLWRHTWRIAGYHSDIKWWVSRNKKKPRKLEMMSAVNHFEPF